MPSPHVSRGGAFSNLDRQFKRASIVAVVGYPKSGKTTAIAEYARQQAGACVWLTVPDSATSSLDWLNLASFHIGQFVGSTTFDRRVLQSALAAFTSKTPLVIVLDDAHLIANLDTLQFIEQAAEASCGRLRFVLVGIDRPDFLAGLRSAGRNIWRLPGFTEKQAALLYKQMAGPLTSLQSKALALLLANTHGHPCMLRLALIQAKFPGFRANIL